MSRAQPPVPSYDVHKALTLSRIQLFLERYVQSTKNLSAQLSGFHGALKKPNLTPERRTVIEARVKVLTANIADRKEIIKELERGFQCHRSDSAAVKFEEYVELTIGEKVIKINNSPQGSLGESTDI